MHAFEWAAVVEVECLGFAQSPIVANRIQRPRPGLEQVVTVAFLDERSQPDVRHVLVLRPQVGAQDACVELVMQSDDHVASLLHEEVQPVIPRLHEPVQAQRR